MKQSIQSARAALVLVDTQNDFFHADGALRRSGFSLSKGRSYIESLIKLADGCRASEMLLVASTFTLIADTKSQAHVPLFLKDLDVKLLRGDFQVSKWGHQVIEEVQPVNYVVDKTGPSAFFRTELDTILRHHGVDSVVIGGLNGSRSVVATAYDALTLGLRPIIATDGSTDYDGDAYDQLISALGGVFDLRSTDEILAALTEPAATA